MGGRQMTSTLVTYCSKEKRKDKTPLPAVERYLSERIQRVWAWARSEDRPMLILSGLLGLIRPEIGGQWRANKAVEVTEYGKEILQNDEQKQELEENIVPQNDE